MNFVNTFMRLKFFLSFLFPLIVLASDKSDYRNRQPNIIVVLTDDLGWSDVSWNNHNVHTTPFMAEMARNGTILTQSYSTHRCSPTRAALLTGRYPWRFGLGSDPIDCANPVGLSLSEQLIPEVVKEKSNKRWKPEYSTHMVGKWHLGNCHEQYLPFNRGFDTFYGHYGGAIDYFNHTKKISKFTYLDYFVGSTPNREKTGVYSTFDFGEETRKIFMEVNKPKFIYLALNAPHDPISAPEELIDEMKQEHPEVTESRAAYLASVKAVDIEMEKIVAAIKTKNEFRDTIIIFQSDNGGAPFIKGERHGCNYPYKGEKTLLTEGGTLVPSFIYSIKDTIVDRVYDGIFHVTDWFPTVLSLAKISKNRIARIGHIDGVDQSAALTDESYTQNDRTQMVYGMIDRKDKKGEWETKVAIRIGDYKFYNYKFDAPTTRCEEGFKNTRIAKMLTRRLGSSKYRTLRWKLRNNSTLQDLSRSNIYAGFSVYNLREDPYELTDISDDKKVWDTLAVNVEDFVQPPSQFLSNCIEKERNLGYNFPVTGARYTFWKSVFGFLQKKKVVEFMRDSGRLNQDEYGDVAGTSYCTSTSTADRQLLGKLLVRQKQRKHRYPYLKKLIFRQYGFKLK